MVELFERQFLLEGDDWRAGVEPVALQLTRIATSQDVVVDACLVGGQGFLIARRRAGASLVGRWFEISPSHARLLAEQHALSPTVEARRYARRHLGVDWLIDEFEGKLAGLVVASTWSEQGDRPLRLPAWVSREVTGRADLL